MSIEEAEGDNIDQDAELRRGIAHESEDNDSTGEAEYDDILAEEQAELEAAERPWYRKEVPLFYLIATGVISSVVGGFIIDYVHTRKHKHEESSLSNKELIMLLVQMLNNNRSDRAVVVPSNEVKKQNTGPDWLQHIEGGDSFDVRDKDTAKLNEICISEMYKVKRNRFGEILDVLQTDQWVK